MVRKKIERGSFFMGVMKKPLRKSQRLKKLEKNVKINLIVEFTKKPEKIPCKIKNR